MTTRDSITFPENEKSKYESKTDLMVAIELSLLGTNLDIAKSLLENYGNIDQEDGDGRTLLVNALLMNSQYINKEIIKCIIEKGASVNKIPNPYKNVNDKIVQEEKITEELIEYVNDCIEKRYKNYIPLILAAKKNDVDILKFLLEKGADINEKDNNDDTILRIGCRDNKIEIVNLALKCKPNSDTLEASLYTAICQGHIECVKILLNAGANMNFNKYQDLFEYIINMDLKINSNCETTKEAFKRGANIKMLNDKGFHVLQSAASTNNLIMFELLIKNGIDVNQDLKGYWSPFDTALRRSKNDSHENLIKYMILAGCKYDLNSLRHCDVNGKNERIKKLLKGEETDKLLIKAIKSKNITMIKVLIKKEPYTEETFIEIIKLNNMELIKFYFENVKPLMSLNEILTKILDETIDVNYDIMMVIVSNLN